LEGKNTTAVAAAAAVSSPIKTLQPDNLIKRTNTFVNLVSKALSTQNAEPAYIKARNEAEEADHAFRVATRKLDRQRLGLEERIEETLKTLQRWEIERLRAVKTGNGGVLPVSPMAHSCYSTPSISGHHLQLAKEPGTVQRALGNAHRGVPARIRPKRSH
jgi:hypothetical protein